MSERSELNYYKDKSRKLERELKNTRRYYKKKNDGLQEEYIDLLVRSYGVLTVFTDVLQVFMENSDFGFATEYYNFYDNLLDDINRKLTEELNLQIIIKYPDMDASDEDGRKFHLFVVPNEDCGII